MTAIVAMALGQEQIKDPTPTEVSTTMAMPSMVSAYLFFEICCIYYSYYLESILFFYVKIKSIIYISQPSVVETPWYSEVRYLVCF